MMRRFEKDDLVKRYDGKGAVSLQRIDTADASFAYLQGEGYWQEDGRRLGCKGLDDPRRIEVLTRDERELYE